ncbi:FAD-linked oxidoreductase [Schizophyllum commune H4-8]|uniref:FAD-linked oxidoreductase n=1 Tax=Schizophyllum commune (strain H4-8 / FGSC 9210) TaxID=578458 RepID=UPI00215E25B7|nr:FAD-linked oxidoreductase [Schizophyllum commune H4-8]KAI5900595.1 FAD-linked oxidoreductase [Schizophyllum commune H4-8]
MASRLFARSYALRRPLLGAAFAAGALGATHIVHADAPPAAVSPSEPLSAYVRTYIVYSLCSVPFVVDASPKLLSWLTAVPGVRTVTEAAVRATFFNQFVGGDTAEACVPLLRRLRARNMGALFAYSVEVDEGTAMGAGHDPANSPHARIVNEMVHSIDVAADFEDELAPPGTPPTARKTWVAVKLTALLPDAHALWNLSAHILEARKGYRDPPGRPRLADVEFPGAPHDNDLDVVLKSKGESIPAPLTQADAAALAQLYSDLCRICTRARERGVRIIIDAEYSWYQPAIDALTHALSRKFNVLEDDPTKVQPLVYGTYQAYLRRTPAHIARAAADAHAGGYSLGVKLVRGAYHPHEVGAWKAAHDAISNAQNPEANPVARMTLVPAAEHPPVWSTKPETDACYDRCVSMLVDLVADDVKTATSASSPISSSIAAPVAGVKRKWYSLGWGKGDASPPTSSADLPATDLTPPKSVAPTSPQPRIGVLFGTHNWASCAGILSALEERGLGKRETVPRGQGESADGPLVLDREVTGRVTIGQLYGMSDDLTESVAARVRSGEPFVIKYVPYGALSEVLPYLGRRAIENKSMLFGQGGAAHERERAWAEIRKRVFG